MWPFKKKRILEVPADKVKVILTLKDIYGALNYDVAAVARYNLWKKIEEVLPECEAGSWRINVQGTMIFIEELT